MLEEKRSVVEIPGGFAVMCDGAIVSTHPCLGNFGVSGEAMNHCYALLAVLPIDRLWQFRDHLLCRSFGPMDERWALLMEWQILWTIHRKTRNPDHRIDTVSFKGHRADIITIDEFNHNNPEEG